jgi:hypothetical protein
MMINLLPRLSFDQFVFLNSVFLREEFKYLFFFDKLFTENVRIESEVHRPLFSFLKNLQKSQNNSSLVWSWKVL